MLHWGKLIIAILDFANAFLNVRNKNYPAMFLWLVAGTLFLASFFVDLAV